MAERVIRELKILSGDNVDDMKRELGLSMNERGDKILIESALKLMKSAITAIESGQDYMMLDKSYLKPVRVKRLKLMNRLLMRTHAAG